MGGLGQMAVMAMGMVQGEKEDPTSAEKTWQEGGRTLHQRYDKDGSHAEFKTILKNGVVVSIEGDNMRLKDLQGFHLVHVHLLHVALQVLHAPVVPLDTVPHALLPACL